MYTRNEVKETVHEKQGLRDCTRETRLKGLYTRNKGKGTAHEKQG